MTSSESVSAIFDPEAWRPVEGFAFTDITYHRAREVTNGRELGAVRIAFDRPEVLNAFRPHTVDELATALEHARTSADVGCVLLTGNGPSPKDGKWAFCSGGDQRIRGRTGYQYAESATEVSPVERGRAGRLHILECQRLIRFMPKVVICVVPGWTAGGGHSLHSVCDLTLASREHARFKQTDADVGSFDGGYGSAYLAQHVGQKFAREIFFLGRTYDAEAMHRMGAVNAVVEHPDLEGEALQWAREILGKSPQAQRMIKYSFNAIDDGLVGQQIFAGETTRLAYMTDEATEGKDQFLEKREPDWSPFPGTSEDRDEVAIRWEALTVDAHDPAALGRWWARTLEGEVVEWPEGVEVRPGGGAVADLLARGAARADVGQPADAECVVLRDPEGNEFRLLDPR